ncbi:hypothetical protein CDD83_540 [Cordyceps sp. RAO-2017]|nr:hypothetical protein CDD83_540 [Cordyceps sp. RAO-2017]
MRWQVRRSHMCASGRDTLPWRSIEAETTTAGPTTARTRRSSSASASSRPSTHMAPWMSNHRPSSLGMARSRSSISPASASKASRVTVPPGSACPISAPLHSASAPSGRSAWRKR